MLELTFVSIFTILPDYLIRRYLQGKRWGQELNLFSVWHELRWGLTGCAILTVTLITTIFYYHPSTTNVSSFFRTVTILSEDKGRVAEVYVANNQRVAAGDPLFKLDDASQIAAAETARLQIEEVDAQLFVAQSDLAASIGVVNQAEAAKAQTLDELTRKLTLKERGSGTVSDQEIERLQNLLDVREGAIEAAVASQEAVEARISTLLPAQRASAEAALEQANTELEQYPSIPAHILNL